MSYIAAFDPGSRNFGYAIVDMKKLTVVENSMNRRTVNTLVHKIDKEQKQKYVDFLLELKARGCEALIAERFQTRGNGGPLIEQISFMLGVASMIFPRYRLVIASQWKTAYKRNGFDIESFYEELKPIETHQIDASLIGLWIACRTKGVPLLTRNKLKLTIKRSSIIAEKIRRIKKHKKANKKTVNTGSTKC